MKKNIIIYGMMFIMLVLISCFASADTLNNLSTNTLRLGFNNTLADTSGNKVSTTAYDSPTFTTDFNGFSNNALYLNGSQYVSINDNVLNNDSKAFSISAWINSSFNGISYLDNNIIISRWSNDQELKAFDFYISYDGILTSRLHGGYFGGYSETSIYAYGLEANKTYFVVVLYSESDNNLKLYVNGDLKNTTTLIKPMSYNTPSLNLPLVGIRNLSPKIQPFYGTIDELNIWNFTLNQANITYLYNNYDDYGISPPTINFTTSQDLTTYINQTFTWAYNDGQDDSYNLSLVLFNSSNSYNILINDTNALTEYNVDLTSYAQGNYSLNLSVIENATDDNFISSDILNFSINANVIPTIGEIINPENETAITNLTDIVNVKWSGFYDSFDSLTYTLFMANTTELTYNIINDSIIGTTYTLNMTELYNGSIDKYYLIVEAYDGVYRVNSSITNFNYTVYEGLIPIFEYGSCPTDVAGSLMFGFILFVAVFILITGLIAKIPFIVMGTSVGLIFYSLFIAGCNGSMGLITAMIGMVCLIYSFIMQPN